MITIMIMRQRKAKSIIVLFSVSTQALDTITGLWQTLPDLLVPRLITSYYHLVLLGYLPTLVILITLLILLINVLWQTFPDLLVPRLVNVIKMVTLVTSFILIILVILVIMLSPPWSSRSPC